MFLTIVIFVAILSLLVFAHEIGHFFTARKFGIRVDEFGFGLPPRVIGLVFLSAKKKIRFLFGNRELKAENETEQTGTIYSLNLIPVGGFVKIKGENGEAAGDRDSFASKAIWRRVSVLAAGVIMNLFLCALILIIGFIIGLPSAVSGQMSGAIVSDNNIQVVEVLKGTAAEQAGLKPGDIINGVDGKTFGSIEELQKYLSGRADQLISLKLTRNTESLTKELLVQKYQAVTGIGVALVETAIVRYPWYLAIWQGIKATFFWLVAIILAFASIIKNLVLGQPIGIEVAGPVGIAVMTGQAARLGLVYVLQFTALLSLNLAIINILPFPALDGGRILFLVIEKIRGRAVKQQLENLIHNIGFALLMLLIVFVTYRDIIRYGGKIFGVFKNLVGI
ncbi:MAG: RIP metalloprotease RseP [Patescibacteria group bacterium]